MTIKSENMIETNTKTECNQDANEEKEVSRIVDAMDEILKISCHAGLEEEELDKASDAFDYITERLSMTRVQALIISMLIDYDNNMYTKNMASYLGVSNIKFLCHLEELEDLVNRKIVRKFKERGQNSHCYEIRSEARKAYMLNEVYETPENNSMTTQCVLDYMNDIFENYEGGFFDKGDFQKDIQDIVEQNLNLIICKNTADLNAVQQIFFFYCSVKYVFDGDMSVSPSEINEYCSAFFTNKLSAMLSDGKDELINRKLIQFSGRNGFSDKDCFTVSDEIQNLFKEELGIAPMCTNKKPKGLKSSSDVTEKKLFYNEKEGKMIEELSGILSVEKFEGVQQRLEKYGMRKGFACLFYGAPGTGKTETALQIARMTGRDIMEVNVAEIKSKWVGDSEKNIRQVFERYRSLCSDCEVMPILLFNEADAIIGRRCDNVKRSVDKMENAIQNIILEEMEKLDGILIATTNLTSNMDPAFERRFLYKIEFKKPSTDIKVKIWMSMMRDLSRDDAEVLANSYDFSGGQIENIVRKDIINRILHDDLSSLKQLEYYCDSELIANGRTPRRRVGFC